MITTLNALAILDKAPYQFRLGGSRRMAARQCDSLDSLVNDNFVINIGDHTDYDFYATYSLETLQYLVDHGFQHTSTSQVLSVGIDKEEMCISESDPYYLDTEAVAIVTLQCSPADVQVVLRKSALFYHNVFESIPVEMFYKYLWKSSPVIQNKQDIGLMFNTMFAVARAAQPVR